MLRSRVYSWIYKYIAPTQSTMSDMIESLEQSQMKNPLQTLASQIQAFTDNGCWPLYKFARLSQQESGMFRLDIKAITTIESQVGLEINVSNQVYGETGTFKTRLVQRKSRLDLFGSLQRDLSTSCGDNLWGKMLCILIMKWNKDTLPCNSILNWICPKVTPDQEAMRSSMRWTRHWVVESFWYFDWAQVWIWVQTLRIDDELFFTPMNMFLY